MDARGFEPRRRRHHVHHDEGRHVAARRRRDQFLRGLQHLLQLLESPGRTNLGEGGAVLLPHLPAWSIAGVGTAGKGDGGTRALDLDRAELTPDSAAPSARCEDHSE
jgi:hypothetical protein